MFGIVVGMFYICIVAERDLIIKNSKVMLNWTKIWEWTERNNLKRKKSWLPLLKSWRHLMIQKSRSESRSELNLLAYPSEVKEAIKEGYLKTYGSETARVLNWYTLTEKGLKIVEDLKLKPTTENMMGVLEA